MTSGHSTAGRFLAYSLKALALMTAAAISFAQSTPSLESLMGSERYRASGLNKLSEVEQAELIRWLQSQGIGTGKASAPDPRASASGAGEDALRAEAQRAREALAAEREALAAEIAAARAATRQMREEQDAALAAAREAETRRDAAERAAQAASQDEFESRLKAPFEGWSGKTLFQLENGQVWRQRLPGRYVHRGGDLPRVRISRNLMGYWQMELVDEGRKVGVTRVR